MKIVVTFFSWDNGHLDAINPLTSKDKLIKKIEDECEDIGDGWLEDYEVSLDDLRNSDGEKLIELCEKISSGGHLNVVDI